jgi:hypothetical protein
MVRPEGGRTRKIDPILLVCSGEPAGVVAEEGFLSICKEPIVIKLVIVFMQVPLRYSHMGGVVLVYSICVAVIDRATKCINTPLKSD